MPAIKHTKHKIKRTEIKTESDSNTSLIQNSLKSFYHLKSLLWTDNR